MKNLFWRLTFEFSTLYTKITQLDLISVLNDIIEVAFEERNKKTLISLEIGLFSILNLNN